MSNVHSALKQEIIRLARREIKQQTTALLAGIKKLKATSAQFKAGIAALQPAKSAAQTGQLPPVSDAEAKAARFSGALIKKLRARLGLSRNAFGKLIGVTGFAVIAWETDECKPNAERRKTIIVLRKMSKRHVAKMLKEGQPLLCSA